MEAATNDTRRNFLKQTAVGTTAVAAMSIPQWAHAAGTDETLRVGLIGCGGRGTQAAEQALRADPNAKLVALGDTFKDRADYALGELKAKRAIRDRVVVDPDHVFSDFDNYKQVIDSVDVVLLATPPHFRPQHFRYAVEQGKHTFVEKPVAVDAPGVRHVLETCEMARQKGLSVVSGLCWRYDFGVRAIMDKILNEKAIGEIIAIESHYNSGGLWHRGDNPEWSRMEYQVRNWIYYTWLAGDHIAEQAIHSLDKTAWLLGDIQPVRAIALGGRQQRTDPKFGHIYDNFSVFFEYPTGQRVFFSCRQQDGCDTLVDERVLATEGQANILGSHQLFDKQGNETWRYAGSKPNMWQQEQSEFFQALRDGNVINNGHYMCNSTMLAIMGRMAGYTGKTLTWEECFNSNERLGPTEYAWTDVSEPPIAIPGRTKLDSTESLAG
jgi:myo-inositol 2-dehydrogenase / D-chiro-inositol 1-dehydrogenase